MNYKSVDDDDDEDGDDDDAADDNFLWLLMFRLSWSCQIVVNKYINCFIVGLILGPLFWAR